MMRALYYVTALAPALVGVPQAPVAHEDHKPAPGPSVRSNYTFPTPVPGSYRLPPIKRAGDGAVLDEGGRPHDLSALLRGRMTVLAFIYTRCGDICPAATHDMSRLQDSAAKDRLLPDFS